MASARGREEKSLTRRTRRRQDSVGVGHCPGGDAERPLHLGWRRSGEIPGYAVFPQADLCSTAYFYKPLI
jgi:hypothetical protein